MAIAVQLVACFSVAPMVSAARTVVGSVASAAMPAACQSLLRGEHHFSASRLTFSDRSSNSLLARCT